jgi:membrane fusion protein, multidrug efflux system
MRWSRIALVAVLGIAAWMWFGRPGGPASTVKVTPSVPAVRVSVATAERRTVPVLVRAPGLVLASETVSVHARIDSQVVGVHFHEGDMVQAGQLLFTLDDRSLTAELHRQEATQATNEAELNNARRQFDRASKLASGGFESTAVLDKARADFETAQARMAGTRADIERLRVMLDYTRITAAIDGRAGVVNATEGNTVKANDVASPLVVINRVKPIRVQFGLPQQALAPLRDRMARGEVATRVIRDNVELPEVGHVEFVDNNIERTTGTFEGRATFENGDEALWPGMICEVVLQLGEDVNVIAIPELAVQHGASGDFVFTIKDSVSHRRPVKVVRYGEGVAVVADGVGPGEVIATDGMMSLSEGSPVVLAGDGAPAAAPATK